MNNKRQTIWLVSMLSLMVILSAYYLFTEDVSKPDQTAQEQRLTTDATGVTGGAQGDDGVQITAVEGTGGISDGTGAKDQAASGAGGASPSPQASPSPSAAGGKDKETAASPDAGKQSDSSVLPEDKEVLKGMSNLSGREYFDDIQLKREQAASKAYEDLNKVIGDSSKTQEEAAAAVEEQGRITATEERITSLQDKLQLDYENAVVNSVDNNKYEIIVQADKLDSKQAVKIVKLATKELGVAPDAVAVQYVP
ncbi:SpoIIIAH-like family protein [Cohnella sp. 56]|uniref:SpoIIIAH-like family protein n=1 Tax=Cohnella sp. 56 TaxID=3113722 RepID=UPI0030EAE211